VWRRGCGKHGLGRRWDRTGRGYGGAPAGTAMPEEHLPSQVATSASHVRSSVPTRPFLSIGPSGSDPSDPIPRSSFLLVRLEKGNRPREISPGMAWMHLISVWQSRGGEKPTADSSNTRAKRAKNRQARSSRACRTRTCGRSKEKGGETGGGEERRTCRTRPNEGRVAQTPAPIDPSSVRFVANSSLGS